MIANTVFFICVICTLVAGSPWHLPTQHILISSQHQHVGIPDRKVLGESPVYYCEDSDPINNIFNITRLDFLPTNPRVGFYQKVRFIGTFLESTGDFPWMTVNATYLDEDLPDNNPFFYGPLCDIEVFQKLQVPIPGKLGGGMTPIEMFRSCPSGIKEGYAIMSSWPIPLWPGYVPVGRYKAKAEAITQDGRRIFCVEGEFEVTK